MKAKRRTLLLVSVLAAASCTTRGPVAMSARELKVKGTHPFDAPFDEVYDAAYLALEQHEGRIASASRLEGVIENDKVEFTAPPGWDGTAYRSYAVSVYQEGARVAVTAVPRLWANDRDVSDEPRWVLPGHGGEEEHWERYFEGIQALLSAWRDVPEMTVNRQTGTVEVHGVRFTAPPDWRAPELAPDRRSAVTQKGPIDGINASIVFEIARRQPAPDAARLELTALEHALGPKVVTPEAWDVTETEHGRRGTGQVVAGEPAKTMSIVWRVWDAREPAWMIRAAAACGAPETPAGCEGPWDSMIDGVTTNIRR